MDDCRVVFERGRSVAAVDRDVVLVAATWSSVGGDGGRIERTSWIRVDEYRVGWSHRNACTLLQVDTIICTALEDSTVNFHPHIHESALEFRNALAYRSLDNLSISHTSPVAKQYPLAGMWWTTLAVSDPALLGIFATTVFGTVIAAILLVSMLFEAASLF